MKRSPEAPSIAKKRARVPSPDRGTVRGPHPQEEPAPQAAATRPAAPPPPVGSPSPSFIPHAFPWTDADDARAWFAQVRGAADDLAVLAREGGRRFKHRYFSRAQLRREARAVEKVILGLLAEAEAGLPPRQDAPRST